MYSSSQTRTIGREANETKAKRRRVRSVRGGGVEGAALLRVVDEEAVGPRGHVMDVAFEGANFEIEEIT